jgi:hypothetical protein
VNALSDDITKSALFLFLKVRNETLHGKLLEVRKRVTDWLQYIPATFPHYTRHSVVHSECIIEQMSRFLFDADAHNAPVVDLSPIEAYIAGCAAYLHDAGMVASDAEKVGILKSDEWRDWTSGSAPGAVRWREIQELRSSPKPSDADVNDFLCDVQTRFLLAEFVRRFHHLRSKEIIAANEDQFAQFAFGDPILKRTIGDVCVSHGLSSTDLEDRDRFPDRREIMGETVNVRFLALILRIGDLLDMSTDRACPLLLNAACPLPPESLAHWTQYQRLTHRLTAPDLIEVKAECENQDEHRFLKDWCSWLVREIESGTVLMSRSSRHKKWVLPRASIDCDGATITIAPSASANYLPCNWQFELRPELVFERLIGDAYSDSNTYVRELLQNSFDATRCQMYRDLQERGVTTPTYPTQVEASIRSQYPIRVTLSQRQCPNQLSGLDEERQFLTIEDVGIGMDEDIIKRFLLQVGESFYTTSEFRKTFRFVPTSRFGVGFLSVFSASDRIEIDTFKPTSASDRRPVHLTLTGPRNYLLLQKSMRRKPGTNVELMLKKPIDEGGILRLVKQWCKRVEFPIIVDELGIQSEVEAETADDFVREWPVIGEEKSVFRLRSFDVAATGIEGSLFVFVQETGGEERWDRWSWSQHEYPDSHPLASPPKSVASITCFHGVVTGPSWTEAPIAERLDIRDESWMPSLSREVWRRKWEDKRVNACWVEIYKEHLRNSNRAKGQKGWVYLQRLAGTLNCPEFWRTLPGTIPFQASGRPNPLSLEESCALQQFHTVSSSTHNLLGLQRREEKIPNDLRWQEGGGNILLSTDVPFLSRHHRDTLFGDRKLDSILLGEGWIRFTWTKSELPKIITGVGYYISVGICDDESFIALNIHKTIDDVYDTVALNGQHPFSKWLLSLEGDEGRGVGKEQIAKAMRNALKLTFEATRYHAVRELQDFITKWNQIENLSPNLVCPVTSFNETMFQAPGAAALFPTNYGVPPTASSQRGKADPQPRTAATKPSRTKRGRIKTGGTKSK